MSNHLASLYGGFSPGGKSIFAGGADKAISIIDSESGKVKRMLPKQSGVVSSLDVSADGKQAAVVYRSSESFVERNQMILWDLGEANRCALSKSCASLK